MRTGRPKALLTVSSDERAHLLAITCSHWLPAALTLGGKDRAGAASASPATRLWPCGLASLRSANRRMRFIADRIEVL